MVEGGSDNSDLSLSIEVVRNEPLRKKCFSPPQLLAIAPAPAAAALFDGDGWREGSSAGKAVATRMGRYDWRGRGRGRKPELRLKSWRREAETEEVSDNGDCVLLKRSSCFQNPVNG